MNLQAVLRTYLARQAVNDLWGSQFRLPEPPEYLAMQSRIVSELRAKFSAFYFGIKRTHCI
jgi:hypothetical protein